MLIRALTTKMRLQIIHFSLSLNLNIDKLNLGIMENRSDNLLNIRPLIPSAKVYESMSADEAFQNSTLRPIIKMQNELLIAVFNNC